jgi:ferritin-like metal-binding protein YciE
LRFRRITIGTFDFSPDFIGKRDSKPEENSEMGVKTLAELFLWHLKDVHGAETHILKALPKMAKRASNSDLRKALEAHLKETEYQVERLNKVFEILGMKAPRQKCKALEGIVEEAEEVAGEEKGPAVLDAGIIAAAQAIEHYEIARYSTLIAWASQLWTDDISALLQATLEEEKHTDEILTAIAMQSVNRKAA